MHSTANFRPILDVLACFYRPSYKKHCMPEECDSVADFLFNWTLYIAIYAILAPPCDLQREGSMTYLNIKKIPESKFLISNVV